MSFETFALTFTPIQGDAIRLYGAPGGASAFISVAELEVFAATDPGNPPPDPPSGVTAPLVTYNHNGSTAAATGGVFYTGTAYPRRLPGGVLLG